MRQIGGRCAWRPGAQSTGRGSHARRSLPALIDGVRDLIEREIPQAIPAGRFRRVALVRLIADDLGRRRAGISGGKDQSAGALLRVGLLLRIRCSAASQPHDQAQHSAAAPQPVHLPLPQLRKHLVRCRVGGRGFHARQRHTRSRTVPTARRPRLPDWSGAPAGQGDYRGDSGLQMRASSARHRGRRDLARVSAVRTT